jgi:hypothetical protein
MENNLLVEINRINEILGTKPLLNEQISAFIKSLVPALQDDILNVAKAEFKRVINNIGDLSDTELLYLIKTDAAKMIRRNLYTEMTNMLKMNTNKFATTSSTDLMQELGSVGVKDPLLAAKYLQNYAKAHNIDTLDKKFASTIGSQAGKGNSVVTLGNDVINNAITKVSTEFPDLFQTNVWGNYKFKNDIVKATSKIRNELSGKPMQEIDNYIRNELTRAENLLKQSDKYLNPGQKTAAQKTLQKFSLIRSELDALTGQARVNYIKTGGRIISALAAVSILGKILYNFYKTGSVSGAIIGTGKSEIEGGIQGATGSNNTSSSTSTNQSNDGGEIVSYEMDDQGNLKPVYKK